MPRKPSKPSLADENAADGGVLTVDRALSVLGSFRADNPAPTLTEICSFTQMYKGTVLRMLSSLEHAGLVNKGEDNRYRLGLEVVRLYKIHEVSFRMEALVMPILHQLVEATQESAAFYVRYGDRRLCLYRVESPQPVRDNIRAGDLMALDRGVPGRIMLAFAGEQGELYDRIRRDGVLSLVGDRVPQIGSTGAPVFKDGHELAGVVTITMPSDRAHQTDHSREVMRAAELLTTRLRGKHGTT